MAKKMLEDADENNPHDELADAQVWDDADLSRLGEVEAYDWGDADPETAGVPLELEQPKLAWLRREVQKGLSGPSEPLDMGNVIAEAETRFRERTTP